MAATTMIVGNLATYPPRRESLITTVKALAPQLDRLNIVLNEYSSAIEELDDFANVHQIIPANDTKDTGKFLPDTAGAEFVFLLDDDLIYPTDYVEVSVGHMGSFPENVVGGYHGSIYKQKWRSNPLEALRRLLRSEPGFRVNDRRTYKFHKRQRAAVTVEQLGTGVTVMSQSALPPFDFMRSSQKFVDVRFARWCFEQKIRQIVLPRRAQWIQQTRHDETIFQDFTKTDHGGVKAEVLSFAFQVPDCGKLPVELKRK